MADSTYAGNANLIVSSSYLYETLQTFKDSYVDTKVEKVNGKGLSTNDFTSALKTSYDSAVTNSHAHSNKSTLDGIKDTDITAWNAKANADHTHTGFVSSFTVTGSGNAITSIIQSGNAVTATKGSTFLTAHPSITAGTNTTSTANPAFGGSFTAIGAITKDANGHVTAFETKTITLPSISFETTALDLSALA